MITKPQKTPLLSILLVIMSSLSLLSCITDATSEGGRFRSTGGGNATAVDTCQGYYDISNGFSSPTCLPNNCNTFTREATQEELDSVKQDLQSQNLSQSFVDDILANMATARAVCLEGSAVLRPDRDIDINTKTLCACLEGKSHSTQSCEAFCSTRNTTSLTIFGSVTLGTSTDLNFGSLEQWCTRDIPTSSYKGPGCKLKVEDESGNVDQLDINIPANSNSFEVNVIEGVNMSYSKIYRISVIESQSRDPSGNLANVETNPATIRLKRYVDPNEQSTGPLKRVPVSKYSCHFFAATIDGTNIDRTAYAEQHYFYISRAKPRPILPNRPLLKCHDGYDRDNRGDDRASYNRLALDPVNFMLWDLTDTRLNDTDSDRNIDINNLITEEFKSRTGQVSNDSISVNRFFSFNWQLRPNDSQTEVAASGLSSDLGVMMTPLVENVGNTLRGKCPTQEDYERIGTDSDTIILNIIGEYVGVDTEGIYMAESEPYVSQTTDANGELVEQSIIDILLVKESELTPARFYFNSSEVPIVPNESSLASNTIHFYYPFIPNNPDPLQKKSDQRLYTVRHPSDIGREDADANRVREGLIPSDNRFGCIPVSSNTAQ